MEGAKQTAMSEETGSWEGLAQDKGSHLKVLLIEDQPVTVPNLLDELHRMGYLVTGIAGSVVESTVCLENHRPDLVVFGRHFQTREDCHHIAELIRTRFNLPTRVLSLKEDVTDAVSSSPAEIEALSTLLQERQRHYWLASALNSAADGIVIVDSEGRVRFLNRAAERLTACTREQATGQNYYDVMMFEHFGSRVTGNLLGLATLSEEPLSLGKDLVLVSHEGRRHQVEGEVSSANETYGSFGSAVFTFRDVAHRKWEERQHSYEQAIRAVERVAETTGHTLNNLLTTILGNGELLVHSDDLLPEHRETVMQINMAAQNVAAVVRQLSTISRNRFVTLRELNMNELISNYMPILSGLLAPGATIVTHLDPTIPMVSADRGQLEQLIFALASNARDAMAEEGTITITTEFVRIESPERLGTDRSYVSVKVKDNGEGMSRDTTDRVFEPFFTLRKDRGRVGLGLSVVQGIVRDYQGFLDITSDLGVGSEVTFAIPAIEAGNFAYLDRSESNPDGRRVNTILVVEDDHAVRQLLRKILEKQDYVVIEAQDAQDAIMVAQLHDGAVDLLITDVAMPGMTGPDLVREFAQSHPETKYLLISGFSADKIGPGSSLPVGFEFLEKPFKQRDLLAKIKGLLEPVEQEAIAPPSGN